MPAKSDDGVYLEDRIIVLRGQASLLQGNVSNAAFCSGLEAEDIPRYRFGNANPIDTR
ncbi:hypothetical protein PS874_02590 [Pseudomonas fluorescens]|nr:hypothetical protein PS874_02590 [Pseudomonas fluorescens]